MRFVFLFSGCLGFTLVALAGWSAGRMAELVLRDAAIACLGCALLGRWFWRIVQGTVAQTAAARRATAEAAAAAEAAAHKAKLDPRTAAHAAAGTPSTSSASPGRRASSPAVTPTPAR